MNASDVVGRLNLGGWSLLLNWKQKVDDLDGTTMDDCRSNLSPRRWELR